MTNQIENLITIKQLSSELFIQPKSLRKKLRDNNIPKPGTRWEWPEGHESVLVIRSWKDQPAKGKVPTEKETNESLEEAIEILEEIVGEPETTEPEEKVLYTKETGKGTWEVIKGPQGVKAIYSSEKATDATKWINSEDDIRATLPKYIKTIINEALVNY